jgi:hypothetical protein
MEALAFEQSLELLELLVLLKLLICMDYVDHRVVV